MGIATFPSTTSPIKSIQRGAAVSAGNITISAVVVAKTIVNSFSTAASGTVAATGTISAASGSTSGISTSGPTGTTSTWGAFAATANETWRTMDDSYTYTFGRYGQFYAYGEITNGTVSLNGMNTNGMNVSLNSTSISGGSTNLVAAVNGAYLSDSTTLVVTGPCRYEVIEYF